MNNEELKPDPFEFKINSIPNVKDNNTFIKDCVGFNKNSTNKAYSAKIIPEDI